MNVSLLIFFQFLLAAVVDDITVAIVDVIVLLLLLLLLNGQNCFSTSLYFIHFIDVIFATASTTCFDCTPWLSKEFDALLVCLFMNQGLCA